MSAPLQQNRQDWMRILALAEFVDLAAASTHLADVEHHFMRPPETGLVMLRGRMGGSGAPFNMGEATVTRCTVRMKDGIQGHAYVMGRNTEHARLAAICDGLLQQEVYHDDLMMKTVKPLAEKQAEARLTKAKKVAATKVDFFTLVRGDV